MSTKKSYSKKAASDRLEARILYEILNLHLLTFRQSRKDRWKAQEKLFNVYKRSIQKFGNASHTLQFIQYTKASLRQRIRLDP